MENIAIAKTIRSLNNLNDMSDDYVKELFLKITSSDKLKNELLFFELEHLTPADNETYDDFDQFNKFVLSSFERYHPRIVNTLLEDHEWTVHTHDKVPRRYPLKHNELIYENTLKREHRSDQLTTKYLEHLLHLFRRYINLNGKSNLRVSLRIIETSDDVYWVIFKVSHNQK